MKSEIRLSSHAFAECQRRVLAAAGGVALAAVISGQAVAGSETRQVTSLPEGAVTVTCRIETTGVEQVAWGPIGRGASAVLSGIIKEAVKEALKEVLGQELRKLVLGTDKNSIEALRAMVQSMSDELRRQGDLLDRSDARISGAVTTLAKLETIQAVLAALERKQAAALAERRSAPKAPRKGQTARPVPTVPRPRVPQWDMRVTWERDMPIFDVVVEKPAK